MIIKHLLPLGAWALAGLLLAAPARSDDALGQRASWTAPAAAEVKQQIDQWLEDQTPDEAAQVKVDALWPPEGGPAAGTETLEQLAATLAAVDEQTAPLVALCRSEQRPVVLPAFAWLADQDTVPLVRHNLRLLYGRWLAQQQLYDEALEQLDGLQPEQVVDPASLLFYQSVAYHRLLDKENCLPAITRLLENEDALPRRYQALAQLMEADLRPLKPDSLDEVARLMDDVRRRLELGRAGAKVRQQEDEVIAKLDKMIEELEEQQQQAGAQGGGQGGGSSQSGSPAADSANLGGSGPGDVDPKDIGQRSGWGNLPPKERQEALQQISKELPAHYREVIEEYFRKLARDDGN